MMGLDLAFVEAGISGTRFAGSILHLPSVDSTNILALAAAQQGQRCGIWIADEQTAGRGRGGHTWHSSPEDGLYVSALLSPSLDASRMLLLSLATGLAARRAIAETTGLTVDIRWPNDLLLNGRKCGGVLVETSLNSSGGKSTLLRYVVIGIGINLN